VVELPGIEPDELSRNIGPELPTTPNARPARHATGLLAKRPPGTTIADIFLDCR
jgi:hypothetical protein